MPMVATVISRRAPSPEIRARDTPNDSAANGSAGVDRASDVDAGINSAPDLGGQRCGDHGDRGDSIGRVYQLVRVGEDDLILEPLPKQLPPWQRRTNVWRRATNPWDGAKRLKSGEAIPAARRNCVRRQRQGPLRVSAAGYFMTVGA
jgi:hypothetical protein